MNSPVTNIILYLHIIFGFTALLSGIVPMVSKKGGRIHKRYGKIYFWAMFGVFVSAIILSIVRPNLFLFLIAIFSFYLAFTGFRIIRLKRRKANATNPDRFITYLMLTASIAMLVFGLYDFGNAKFSINFVLLVFGLIGFSLAYGDIRRFRASFKPKSNMEWFFNHLTRMLAAYIATFTAFAVVNITFLPGLLVWLGPTVVGTIGITAWNTYYRRKFSSNKKRAVGKSK